MAEQFEKTAPRPKKRIVRAVLAIVLIALLLFGCFAAYSITWNSDIAVASYSVESDRITGEGFRIVLISDLHRKKFDETNQLVVERTREQEPDLICVCGDMLERDASEEEIAEFANLLERLIEIAPVCFSAGNHDAAIYFNDLKVHRYEYVALSDPSEATAVLEATGAKLLECEYADIEVKGERIRIGGIYGPAYRMAGESDDTWLPRKSFLEDFCDTDLFRLMLSHRPGAFVYQKTDWNAELVLSGHTHNGVIALPFGLGAIWTSEGFFPKYDRGIFHEENLTLVISAGLDGHNWIPRVFNPPEIAVIDVLPEGAD